LASTVSCKVHASEIFGDDDDGLMHETRDFAQLRLYQDGESTPVSDLMARENHVFTAAPRAAVDAEVDGRLPVFEAGPFLLAFDGAALLKTPRRSRPAQDHSDLLRPPLPHCRRERTERL
jgi:hypothetical protein